MVASTPLSPKTKLQLYIIASQYIYIIAKILDRKNKRKGKKESTILNFRIRTLKAIQVS